MKQILTIVTMFSVFTFSCNSVKAKVEETSEYSTIELVEDRIEGAEERDDFQSFISLFKKVELPFELKYGNFSAFNQADPGIDSFAFKLGGEDNLPFETINQNNIKLWILGNGDSSEELDEWLEDHLDNPDNDWFSITSGIYYENQSLDTYYVLINTYKKTSESNGGYYTEWLLEYDSQGVMRSCHKLGQEGYYSSRHVDFETGDYKGFLSCKSLKIKFINRYYVTVSSLEWSEMEGRLEDEDFIGIGSYYEKDGSIIYGVKENVYSIKF